MKFFTSIIIALVLSGCATSPNEVFDSKYSRSEIAIMTAEHFDVLERDASAALRPAFNKYGAPHAYIDGLMSSVDVNDANHLYGSGHFQTKLTLKEHTFWRVDGENLTGHLRPVQTAHLVYNTLRLDPLSNSLEFSETLTKRGKTFTVFEKQMGDEIIITVHKSEDLQKTKLNKVKFFNE